MSSSPMTHASSESDEEVRMYTKASASLTVGTQIGACNGTNDPCTLHSFP